MRTQERTLPASALHEPPRRGLDAPNAAGETLTSPAETYAARWLAEGWLERRLAGDAAEESCELSEAAIEAIRFTDSLERRRSRPTESRLSVVPGALERLAIGSRSPRTIRRLVVRRFQQVDQPRLERRGHVGMSWQGANLYRDGQDTVGWHGDDEPEPGEMPVIASASFGATRRFDLRHRSGGPTIGTDPAPGSIMVMSGRCQSHWKHRVARTRRVVAPRINLTFRRVGA